MAGRTLGNNSLWSVEEAEAELREVKQLAQEALVAMKEAAERGRRLQDVVVVSAVADARVALSRMTVLTQEALGRLQDAKAGVWRGEDPEG